MDMNNKRKINIIDLIFSIALVLIILVGAIKIAGNQNTFEKSKSTKVFYTVEVSNSDPEILNYISEEDRVFEDETLKNMGTVVGVSHKPSTVLVENNDESTLVLKELPDKITVNIEITADGVETNGSVSVDSANILVGKSVDLIVGDSALKGVITALNYEDTSIIKEEN